MPRARTGLQRLNEDSRGAIMVIGVVIGALLVGVLWHVASIGDAVIWRERAQDAADAAAFENAVWHARGMNMIVAINIVMALVLSILVIWRLILVLVTVALILATILCVVTLGGSCGLATTIARVEGFMLRNDSKVANNVTRVLGAMNAVEVAVATATPIVALGVAKENTEAAYDVKSAWTQSMSLLPSINDKGFQTLKRCAKGMKTAKIVKNDPTTTFGKRYKMFNDYVNQARMGFLVSLPVQAETYGLLCDKAGQFVLNSLAGVLEGMGFPSGTIDGLDKAKTALGAIVSSFPGIFCAPLGGPPPELGDFVTKQSKDSCKGELDGLERRFVAGPKETEVQYKNSEGKFVTEDQYMKKCMKDKQKAANDKLKGAFKDNYSFAECGQPAKVWEWAVNGNVFMRSFAEVKKDAPMLARDDKGLLIAGFHSGAVEQPTFDDIVAHAEMFYDCTGGWASPSCRSNAMWAMRWKARLRRVQSPGKLVSTALEPILVSTLTQMLNELANDKGTPFLQKLMGKVHLPPLLLPKLKETWVARQIKTNLVMGGLYRSNAFEWVGKLVENSSAESGVLH